MTDTDHREITEFRNWVFDALQTVNDGNCNMGPLADEIAKVAAAMARVEPDHDPAQGLYDALKEFCFGDPDIEKILWGDKSDDALGTFTFKLGTLRKARAALTAYERGRG